MEMTMWDFIYEMREILIVCAIGFTIITCLVVSIIRVLIEEVVYCRRAGIEAHVAACSQVCKCQQDQADELAAEEILKQARANAPTKQREIYALQNTAQ